MTHKQKVEFLVSLEKELEETGLGAHGSKIRDLINVLNDINDRSVREYQSAGLEEQQKENWQNTFSDSAGNIFDSAGNLVREAPKSKEDSVTIELQEPYYGPHLEEIGD